MEKFEIYEDIKTRSNGDIYVGVVGPVRCGKSLFISKFMKNLVIPNIENKQSKERAIDELPQSAEGRTIMTTQPKFVPAEAVEINVNNVKLNVRMVDCVGYLVGGVMGHTEGDKPRLVKTPWSEQGLPFEEAAEIGTKKVITEHSTFGIVMTTDGTVTDLNRNSYVDAEQRVATEMKNTGKPFVIVVNSSDPQSETAQSLAKSLEEKYEVPALALNVETLSDDDVEEIFEKVLSEFPLKSFQVKLPTYLQALDFDNEIIQSVIEEVKNFADDASKIGNIEKTKVGFVDSEDFMPLKVDTVDMGEGVVKFEVVAKPELFYKVLSSQCGTAIANDFELVSYIKELAHAKKEYDKIEKALNQVEENGYGVVTPLQDEMLLDNPEIVKQGGKYAVKIKASAPTLHIMKVDVETEINPMSGSMQQCEDMIAYLESQYDEEGDGMWSANMFGRTLKDYVNDGMSGKVHSMPVEAQKKMRKTLCRIVNEGKGGIICILL